MTVLRRLCQAVLRARWLLPVHPLARSFLGVSQLPGPLTAGGFHGSRSHSRASGEDLVVLTANLWHDWPLGRRLPQRLEAFAKMVEAGGADVVLLQEVTRTKHLWADRWLSERLDMHYLYSRVNGHQESIGFEEGLAVFARFPLLAFRTRRLSTLGGVVHRLALGAELECGAGKLWVFSVHLSLLRRLNALQVSDLQTWVNGVAGGASAVVGGDFNAPETAPQMRRARRSWQDLFRRINPHADGTTHELRWPWGSSMRRHRLDYLFLQQGEPEWRVVESRHLESPEEPHSDHRAVLARLRSAR